MKLSSAPARKIITLLLLGRELKKCMGISEPQMRLSDFRT